MYEFLAAVHVLMLAAYGCHLPDNALLQTCRAINQ